MMTKTSIAAAVALAAFLAVPGAPVAQQQTQLAASCLGGGCTGENPDRQSVPSG